MLYYVEFLFTSNERLRHQPFIIILPDWDDVFYYKNDSIFFN